MNQITHRKLVIEFDVWQPYKKELEAELDDLLGRFKARHLLPHAGNLRTVMQETGL